MDRTVDCDYGRIEDVLFVGGGDAGLMTALALREHNPQLNITIVDDVEGSAPEVGKSTFTYILEFFHDILGIEETRFVNEVRPVWKGSIYFKDWCGKGPFHVPFDGFALQPLDPGRERFETLYHRYETGNFRTLGEEIAERQLTPVHDDGELYKHVAYQFGTDRLNAFLREVCTERGIELIDDEITDATTSDNRIEEVTGGSAVYEADLYFDATGFDRTLMGQLDVEFDRVDFPLDSALVAKTDVSLSEIEPATVIHSGDSGWFWQIDTFGWRDLGYVYSSDHASEEEAVSEFIEARDEEISESDIRRYEFDSGVYRKAWVNNCVAVGNTLGFIEPLQSTALTLNARLTERLAELLSDHHCINHQGVRDIYNELSHYIWKDVVDFISIHYLYAEGETEFWNEARSVAGSDQVKEYIDRYRKNGFNSFEFFDRHGDPTVTVFNHYLYYHLLHALGVEPDLYENIDVDVTDSVEQNVEKMDDWIATEVQDLLPYEEVYQKELDPPLSVVLQ